jgi:predicted amidophosphoribosyltransferase
VTICPRCRAAIAAPRRLDGAAPALPDGLPVWGLGVYREELRRLVLAWKVGGRRDLDPVLDAALARVVDTWLDAVPRSATGVVVEGDHPGPGGRGEVWVVPAPSRAGRALRGRPAVSGLADAVARRLAANGEAARVVAALASRGRSTHHVGNGPGRGRHARVVPRLGMAGREIVLVDDVLTTGETLARCRSAVLAAGGQVRGAVVLAAAGTPATPLRLPTRPRVD